MKCAFGRTQLIGFQKSPLKQRARLPKCNNAGAIDTYALSYRIVNVAPGYLSPIAWIDPSDKRFYGLSLFPAQFFRSWDSLGYFDDNGASFSTPKLRSRGMWRIDLRVQTYYGVRPDSAFPGHSYLYINLYRYNNSTGGSIALAQKDTVDPHRAKMTAGHPPTFDSTITLANPHVRTDPTLVLSTWKFDLSTGPLDVTDYLIVDEVSTYCHPVFFAEWSYLTGSLRPFTGAFGQNVGYDVPAGYNVEQGGTTPTSAIGVIPNLPGDWIVPIPPVLAGGPIPYTGVPLSSGDFNGLILAQWDLTFTRIPNLHAAFQIQKLSTLNYRFTSISLGSPTTYNWDFGDLSTHGTTNPVTHVFAAAGTYNVKLTIGNAYGQSADHTIPLTVS